MSKKTYFLILFLIVISTYLAYLAVVKQAPKQNLHPTQVTLPVYQATLSISPNPLAISPLSQNQNQTVEVLLDSPTQKATAVQIELSFDPKVISNLEIQPGSFFQKPVELLKNIDKENGKISYAVGVSPTESGKSGKGTVAILSFSVNLQVAKTSQISFLPKTMVTAESSTKSVLKSSIGTLILFEQQEAAPSAIPLKTSTSSAQ